MLHPRMDRVQDFKLVDLKRLSAILFADLKVTYPVLQEKQEFTELVKRVRNMVIGQKDSGFVDDDDVSLDDSLTRISGECLKAFSSTGDKKTEEYKRAQALKKKFVAFDCGPCARRDGKCGRDEDELQQFLVDGGDCIVPLTNVVLAISKYANEIYARATRGYAGVGDIDVCIRFYSPGRFQSGHETRFDNDGGAGSRAATVLTEFNIEAFEGSYLRLFEIAYILAHEVMVHAVQATAHDAPRSDNRFSYGSGDRFGEGVVDAVVFERLVADLPRLDLPYKFIGEAGWTRARDAITKLNQTRRDDDGCDLDRSVRARRRAVRWGYGCFQAMKGHDSKQKDSWGADWVQNFVLEANLLPLTLDERERLIGALERVFAPTFGPTRPSLAKARNRFSQFLEDPNLQKMRDFLDVAGPSVD